MPGLGGASWRPLTASLARFCPDDPGCLRRTAHAGRGHVPAAAPAPGAYCAPGRCYCGTCGAEPAPAPAPTSDPPRRRWGRYAQADADLVADLVASVRRVLRPEVDP